MSGLSCNTGASVLRCRQDLPGPGTKLASPALAGGLLTPGSPGKPFSLVLMVDASTWSIRVFQVSVCHHVNHEICSLSSKEKQRTMFAGHSHFMNIFLPCRMETNRCILTPENKVLPYGIQSSEGKWEPYFFPILKTQACKSAFPSSGRCSQDPSVPSFSNLWVENAKIFFEECVTGLFRMCRFYRWQSVIHVSVFWFPRC